MTLLVAAGTKQIGLSTERSVWWVLAVLNGLAFAMPASRFGGSSAAVLMALFAAVNVMAYLALAGRRIRVSKRDVQWIRMFALVAGYLTVRTGVAVMFEAPAPVAGFDLASGLREWRGDLSWLFYTASLWLAVCGSGRKFKLKIFIRAWFLANFAYWAWTAAFGLQSSVFHAFDARVPTARLALLGYEPSYTGPMLIIMALLLLAQRPVRRFDLAIVLTAVAAFFEVFSKAAVVAMVIAIAATGLLYLGTLVKAVARHWLISLTLTVTTAVMAVIAFSGDLANAFKSDVITPLVLGPDSATTYAMSGEAGSFATRYLAMTNAVETVWPSHLVFGFGQGIYHFAVAHTAFRSGRISAELAGYISTSLGAFTAKSDVLNLVLSGGLVGLVGLILVMVTSFKSGRGQAITGTVKLERHFLFIFMAVVLVLTERLPVWSLLLITSASYLAVDKMRIASSGV